ncbi:MAG: gliding motility-associated-like protein [Saprospiraceae bacterium]|jgi:gliding motility-associated-like protein
MKNLLVYFFSIISFTFYAQEVVTIAGTGSLGSTDGIAEAATFNNPHGIAVDNLGNIYVADRHGHKIRKITPAGIVSTLAGSGVAGKENGNGAAASFNEPYALCVDGDGNVYVADTKNNVIRKITPLGEVSTYAGNGNYGITDGPVATASFGNPTGIDVDAAGNLYVADHMTHIIRKITPDGTVSRIAGAPYCTGLIDGNVNEALFNRPYGLTLDNYGNIIVADEWNHAIRLVSPSGEVSTIAGNGTGGHDDGSDSFATFFYPWDVAVDASNNIFVADGYNHSIRKIIPSASLPISFGVLTFAGASNQPGWLDGYGTEAKLNGAAGLHYCKLSGEVFIADTYNNKIRKVIDHNEQSMLLQIIDNEQGVICENEACKARAFPLNFDTYIFLINGQIVQSSASADFETSSLVPGAYSISCHGINAQGSFMSKESTFTVLETPIPVIAVDGVLPMPQESSVILTTDEAVLCTWSTGVSAPSIIIEEPSIITVDVLFTNGCTGTSEPLNVQQYCSIETPIIEFENVIGDDECYIETATLITAYDGDIQWMWNGEDIPGATEKTLEVTEGGTYQIMATTYEQNVYSNALIVNIGAPLIKEITANKTVIFENKPEVKFKLNLLVDGDYSYLWNFGDVDSGDDNFSTKKDPKHKFSGVGVYSISLKVTDNTTGCSETMHKPDMIVYIKSLTIREEEMKASPVIFVPNAFSPNGDGENDVLYVRGEEIGKQQFFVYNQKGSLVFQSNDQSIGWDGNIRGNPAPNDTYSYLLILEMNTGENVSRTGKVFVIR